jgi:3-deoxy-manno-octulosonate cytidylyltransferase (CMP-KDO synthetase)
LTIIIIPARYASTRYPGKPLVQLRDRNGVSKSLIQRSWETAMAVSGVGAVYVATDDQRIADASHAFGAKVVMTSETARNGTERCAEAVRVLGLSPNIVVNLQGDAPLTPPWFVEALIDAMKADQQADVATPVLRCDLDTYTNFVTDRQNGRVGGTTAVFNKHMRALYFSKEVVPYLAKPPTSGQPVPVFHHVGVYAYRPQALLDYAGFEEGPLEKLEGLEQLRFMENGRHVSCVEVDARGRVFWELNNPVDVERIEAVL